MVIWPGTGSAFGASFIFLPILISILFVAKVDLMPNADDWSAAVFTTFGVMLVSGAIAIGIGIPSAFAASTLTEGIAIDRRKPSWKTILVRIWMLTMLITITIPLILHAASWEASAGKFGWLLKTVTGGNLMWVGWIHGVHGAAMVGLATYWGTRGIDTSVIRNASLDNGPLTIWWKIRVPLAKSWILASVVGVLALAATEMSVADLHSVRTVADQFYLFHSLDADTTAILFTTLIPVVIGFPILGFWLWHQRDSNRGLIARFQLNEIRPAGVGSLSSSMVAGAATILASCIVIVFCLPVGGLAIQAGHIVKIVDGQPSASWSLRACVESLASAPSLFYAEFGWTIQLCVWTTLFVIPLAWLNARASRSLPVFGRVLDWAALTLFLIPGPIIGMAIVRFFLSGPMFLDRLATETLVPTIMALSVRAGVIAYVIMRVGYSGIASEIWDSAKLDGGFAWRAWNIELPLLRPTFLIAGIAVVIVASGDVPSILPVAPPGVTTVGTRLFGLLHSGARYQEASLAFWHTMTIIALATVMGRRLR